MGLRFEVLLGAALVVSGAGLLAERADAQYTPGFVWNRFADYDAGTEAGANYLAGNPSTDSVGNLVWSHEWCIGGDLNSTNPWWRNPAHLMVWDLSWYGGGSLWAAGDNVNPPIGRSGLTHNTQSEPYPRVPRVRWRNPLARSAVVRLSGQLTVIWTGGGGHAQPNTIDVVIGLNRADGTTSVLYSATVDKPTNDNSEESLPLPIDVPSVAVDPGDSIVITHRARTQNGGWIELLDDQLNIVLVSGGDCPEDINADGVVDLVDLARVLGAFGSVCP